MNRAALPILLFQSLALGVAADDAPGPASGSARLPSGITARYEYHFDRNALSDSRISGESLIALTDSGNLLRFDLETRRLTGEWFGPFPVTCLGRAADAGVLAGFEDGRVCRVDPGTLVLAEVARLPGPPQWVAHPVGNGKNPGDLIAVVEQSEMVEQDGHRWERKSSVVHDLASGSSHEVGRYVTAFLLDSRSRLWLGGDMGEWGGWCSVFDPADDTLRSVPGITQRPDDGDGWEGVYGFVELRDGRVWAYGGTAHMGITTAFIRRVDGGKAEELYALDNIPAIEARMEGHEEQTPDRPTVPITQVVEEPDGNLLVLAYSEIYRIDPALGRWTRLHGLGIRYRWGRPDAVGAYPSVRAVHLPDGEEDGLLLATALDGYVRVADGEEASHALPGQLGAGVVERIEATEAGTLFLERDDSSPAWRLREGAWEPTSLAPPVRLHPDEPEVDDPLYSRSWYETRIMAGPDGEVFTVSASALTPGTRTTARLDDGEPEVLGREVSWLIPSACFVTPDGMLWNAWSFELKRFIRGRWSTVAPHPGAEPDGELDDPAGLGGFRAGVGFGLRAVGDEGPPWVLLDRSHGRLLHLFPGLDDQRPRLEPIQVVDGGEPLRVHDAIPRSRDELLLATDRGLRTFERSTAEARSTSLPEPGDGVTLLCRDGLGRLWLAGKGLWMTETGTRRLHSMASLPMMGRTEVTALAADPSHPDGVIAALGRRGVVFLRIAEDGDVAPDSPR